MPKEKKEKIDKKIKSSGKGQRFADMSATAEIIEEPKLDEAVPETGKKTEKKKTPRAARVRGKKYQSAKKLIDPAKAYPIKEAVELLKRVSLANFDSSVEAHFNVTDKGLSGNATLPHFKGKARKIAIFDEKVEAVIKSGKLDFEILLAKPADMPRILPLAKILGPKGLMPNPKNDTLTDDPKKVAEKLAAGGFHYKTEKDFPVIHTVIGKLSQPDKGLIANLETLIAAINPKKITKTVIKSTMSPGIKIAF